MGDKLVTVTSGVLTSVRLTVRFYNTWLEVVYFIANISATNEGDYRLGKHTAFRISAS